MNPIASREEFSKKLMRTAFTEMIADGNVKAMANNILAALDKHYPAYSGEWNIQIDTRPTGGVLRVRNLLISGKMGFQIPLAWVDYEMNNVVRYAGELLERFKLSRDKNVDVIDELKNLERNGIGEAKHDE